MVIPRKYDTLHHITLLWNISIVRYFGHPNMQCVTFDRVWQCTAENPWRSSLLLDLRSDRHSSVNRLRCRHRLYDARRSGTAAQDLHPQRWSEGCGQSAHCENADHLCRLHNPPGSHSSWNPDGCGKEVDVRRRRLLLSLDRSHSRIRRFRPRWELMSRNG